MESPAFALPTPPHTPAHSQQRILGFGMNSLLENVIFPLPEKARRRKVGFNCAGREDIVNVKRMCESRGLLKNCKKINSEVQGARGDISQREFGKRDWKSGDQHNW